MEIANEDVRVMFKGQEIMRVQPITVAPIFSTNFTDEGLNDPTHAAEMTDEEIKVRRDWF